LLRCRDAHRAAVVVVVVVVVVFVDVAVVTEMVGILHGRKDHLYVALSSNSTQVASVSSSLIVFVQFEVVAMMFQ